MSKHYCKGKTVLYVIERFHKVGAFDGVKLFSLSTRLHQDHFVRIWILITQTCF